MSPPVEEDVPPTLQEIAYDILEKNPNLSEEELARLFSEKRLFNDSNIEELEKATRNQLSQNLWKEQRKERITASNFHGVYAKVEKLLRMMERGENQSNTVACEVFRTTDLSNIPAIKWGRLHEKDAGAAFSNEEGKQHANLHVVFFFCKAHPYLGATPYNVFTCSCCGSSCTEYKCPYSSKDLTIEEGWEKTDFLEIDEKLRLKISHKYHFKSNGNLWL